MILERVLILSVTAGEGHMRAAAAIKGEIMHRNPQAQVEILDTFRYASPLMEKVILGTYMEIIKLSPVIYGFLYRQAEKEKPISGFAKHEFNRIMNRLAAPKLISLIDELQPQAIVCTHPFPLGILVELRRMGKCPSPIVGVITDFTVHPFWVFEHVDCYLVAAPKLIDAFNHLGISSEKVKATGIPIDRSFSILKEKALLKTQWKLDPNLPVVLVMGGGLGMGPLADVVKEVAFSQIKCQLVVVCGRNEPLRTKLLRMLPELPGKIHILGFVTNIQDLMGASDLMIGKAGGLTSSEAMASSLPMLIIDPIPGQEERNAEFLELAGAAKLIRGSREVVPALSQFFSNQDIRLKMTEAAHSIGRPNSAAIAVDHIKYLIRQREELDIDLG